MPSHLPTGPKVNTNRLLARLAEVQRRTGTVDANQILHDAMQLYETAVEEMLANPLHFEILLNDAETNEADIFMAMTLEALRKQHKPQQLRAISANDAAAPPSPAPV